MTSLSFRKEFIKPDEEKDRALGFIKWGKKNDYPYFLVDLFNGSAWHQGIIKTKTFFDRKFSKMLFFCQTGLLLCKQYVKVFGLFPIAKNFQM